MREEARLWEEAVHDEMEFDAEASRDAYIAEVLARFHDQEEKLYDEFVVRLHAARRLNFT